MIEEYKIYFEKEGAVISGITYIIAAQPNLGFNCGISIFIPDECEKNTTILMHSCNTGGRGLQKRTTAYHLDEANEVAKQSTYEKPNPGMWIGNDLKMPVMIPLIPRVAGYYTQALGSSVRNNDVSTLIADQKFRKPEDKLSIEEIEQIRNQCMNLPEQLVSMIKFVKQFLEMKGIVVDDKVIAEGYSAGSKFANCFTALHPECVKACVCGGNSGLGIIPLSEIDGVELKYPIGISDVLDFNEEEFKNIPQMFYIGTEDENDPAMAECNYKKDNTGNYILNEDGSRIPLRDKRGYIIPKVDEAGKTHPRHKENYSQEEFEIIQNMLGKTVQERYNNNEYIYNMLGLNSQFNRFPGTHDTVTKNQSGAYVYTNECIKEFIRNYIKEAKQKK